MAENAVQIGQGILANIRSSLKQGALDWLDKNQEAKAFLEDRTKRAGELVVEYAEASDADKPAVQQYMSVVYQTIRNETLAVVLSAEESVKDMILSVLGSAFQFALQNLPMILALIPK